MAGRHRGPIAPGPEFGDDASATSPYAFVLDEFQGESAEAADKGSASRRPARGTIPIVVSIAIAVVAIAAAALVLSGRGVRHHDAPQALAQTTAEATPAKPTPEELPTTGMFVPPRQPATPVVRKSTPTKKMPSHPPSQAKPPCPFQVPFARDWCNAHGYAPPPG